MGCVWPTPSILHWDQVDFSKGCLHVKRPKGGIVGVHPVQGDELRALRGPFDERFCRNSETLVQSPDHLERRWPLAIEHFAHS
jgi:hypothetical protein